MLFSIYFCLYQMSTLLTPFSPLEVAITLIIHRMCNGRCLVISMTFYVWCCLVDVYECETCQCVWMWDLVCLSTILICLWKWDLNNCVWWLLSYNCENVLIIYVCELCLKIAYMCELCMKLIEKWKWGQGGAPRNTYFWQLGSRLY
jgi:hypothetical protein